MLTDVANDYVTNAKLTSRLNYLKSHHIATEVKTIDDKTKKNTSDILGFESRLKQKEDIVDEVQREISFNRGFFYYLQRSYLVYECKIHLILVMETYQSGNQRVFLIIQMILI